MLPYFHRCTHGRWCKLSFPRCFLVTSGWSCLITYLRIHLASSTTASLRTRFAAVPRSWEPSIWVTSRWQNAFLLKFLSNFRIVKKVFKHYFWPPVRIYLFWWPFNVLWFIFLALKHALIWQLASVFLSPPQRSERRSGDQWSVSHLHVHATRHRPNEDSQWNEAGGKGRNIPDLQQVS